MISRSFFIILLVFSLCNISGQNFGSVQKFENTEFILEKIEDSHTKKLESSNNEKALEKVYEWRRNYITQNVESGYIFYNEKAYSYLDNILNKIYISNPELKNKGIKIFFTDNPTSNSFSLGDGTILVNLGLLRMLENESQFVYVLCHEIAHYILDHSDKTVIARYELQNSDPYKEKLEEIKKSKYNRYSSAMEFAKKHFYDFMSHSRKDEYEADHIALELYIRTKYPTGEAINTLKSINRSIDFKYSKNINLRRIFDFESYAFKDRWIQEEVVMFGGNGKSTIEIDEEKSRTHPHIEDRIEKLKEEVLKLEKKESIQANSTAFTEISTWSEEQLTESYIRHKKYGKALYFTLKKLEEDNYNKEMLLTLSRLMKLIYHSHVDHQYHETIERPSSDQTEEYKVVLEFLDNIRLSEWVEVAYFFHMENSYVMDSIPEFNENLSFFRSLKEL